MRKVLEHWRILAAALFSAALVYGAYALARDAGAPAMAEASSETALLQALAARDSTGDGLPDWQKALYGIPLNATTTDYFHLGMTDGEAVAKGLIVPKAIADVPTATSSPVGGSIGDPSLPAASASGTLTAAFAQDFFSLYLARKQAGGNAPLSKSDLQDIANQALASLASSVAVAPDFKSKDDLMISGSGPEAMRAFATNAEAVLVKNTNDATMTDIDYLKGALTDNDTSAFAHIASIAKSYRGGAAGLAVLPVPRELAASDLALMNALMRLSEIDNDFTRAYSDPVVTMIALHQYADAVAALDKAFSDIGVLYKAAGVTLVPGAPGAAFVNMSADSAASPAAATKP